jgi:hypothetical protein
MLLQCRLNISIVTFSSFSLIFSTFMPPLKGLEGVICERVSDSFSTAGASCVSFRGPCRPRYRWFRAELLAQHHFENLTLVDKKGQDQLLPFESGDH